MTVLVIEKAPAGGGGIGSRAAPERSFATLIVVCWVRLGRDLTTAGFE
jgi:hypothetical protein